MHENRWKIIVMYILFYIFYVLTFYNNFTMCPLDYHHGFATKYYLSRTLKKKKNCRLSRGEKERKIMLLYLHFTQEKKKKIQLWCLFHKRSTTYALCFFRGAMQCHLRRAFNFWFSSSTICFSRSPGGYSDSSLYLAIYCITFLTAAISLSMA